jgi:hypothetical protein
MPEFLRPAQQDHEGFTGPGRDSDATPWVAPWAESLAGGAVGLRRRHARRGRRRVEGHDAYRRQNGRQDDSRRVAQPPRRDGRDNRLVRLWLTDAGGALQKRIEAEWRSMEKKVSAGLTETERKHLLSALAKIHRSASALLSGSVDHGDAAVT